MSTTPVLLRRPRYLSDEHVANELTSSKRGQLLTSIDVRARHVPSAAMLTRFGQPPSSSRRNSGGDEKDRMRSTSASHSAAFNKRVVKRGSASNARVCCGGQPLPSTQVSRGRRDNIACN